MLSRNNPLKTCIIQIESDQPCRRVRSSNNFITNQRDCRFRINIYNNGNIVKYYAYKYSTEISSGVINKGLHRTIETDLYGEHITFDKDMEQLTITVICVPQTVHSTLRRRPYNASREKYLESSDSEEEEEFTLDHANSSETKITIKYEPSKRNVKNEPIWRII